MKTTVSARGQLILPAKLRERDRIEPGQEFEIERLGPGKYQLTRVAARHNEGVVDWLLACPEKGFFEPIYSESIDSLRAPSSKRRC